MQPTIFQKNLALVAQFNPELAKELENFDVSNTKWVKTKSGEPNLQLFPENIFLHSEESATLEASELAKRFASLWTNTLIIYGPGLGYIFDSLKEWLNSGIDKTLIFIEDDLRVLYRLLETSKGTEILQDQRTFLVRMKGAEDPELLSALRCAVKFNLGDFRVFYEGIPSYIKYKQDHYRAYRDKAYYLAATFPPAIESMTTPHPLDENFFANFLEISESLNFKPLMGKFKNIPAVICGGGASLEKDLPLLKKLHHRALIFAGGTTLNILGEHSIYPHFTGGVDPTFSHLSRFLMQKVYETPYLFVPRIAFQIIPLIQGTLLALGDSDEDLKIRWLKERCNIDLCCDAGAVSITTFLISAAKYLGCNPIIFLGLDLGLSGGKNYAKGVKEHPIISQKLGYERRQEPLFETKDIHGNAINTTYQFMLESTWIANKVKNDIEVRYINATSGGAPIDGVQNTPMSEVVNRLGSTYDLSGLIHYELEKLKVISSKSHAHQKLNEFKTSLLSCVQKIDSILQEKEIESALYTEDAYIYYLKKIHEIAFAIQKDEERLSLYKWEEKRDEVKKEMKRQCFQMLKNRALSLISLIESLNESLLNRSIYIPKQTSVPEKREVEKLHGFSTFYAENGALISKTTFKDGFKEGEDLKYFSDGTLCSRLNFIRDLFHGKQEYFYPDGSIKSIIHYLNGVLHGCCIFYYPDGQKKREQHFENGLREGVDRIFYANGQLWMEEYFHADVPVDIAKSFFPDGTKEVEMEINDCGEMTMVKLYNQEGKVVQMKGQEKKILDGIKELQKVSKAIQDVQEELIEKLKLLEKVRNKNR